MKRKIWTIVSTVLLSGLMVSCSDDDVAAPDDVKQNPDASSYVTLTIAMPSSDDTRASTDTLEGSSRLEGTTEEREIKEVRLYVFKEPTTGDKSDDNWVLADEAKVVGSSNLTNESKDDANSVYRVGTAVFKLLQKSATGVTYHLYAVVNAEAVDDAGQSWVVGSTTAKDFLEKSRFNIDKTTGESNMVQTVDGYGLSEGKLPTTFTGGFVMASRQFDDMNPNAYSAADNITTTYAPFTIYSNNSEDKPASVTIAVERVMARLDLGLSLNYDEGLTNPNNQEKYATIKIDKYCPINLSKQSYLFRHRLVGSSSKLEVTKETPYSFDNLPDLQSGDWNGSAWNVASYVVDPQTLAKTEIYSEADKFTTSEQAAFQTKWSSVLYNTLHGIQSGSGESYKVNYTFNTIPELKEGVVQPIGYCLENTAIADYQMNEYSTGFVFQGTVTPDPNHVYYLVGDRLTWKGNTGTDDDKSGNDTYYADLVKNKQAVVDAKTSEKTTAENNLKNAEGAYKVENGSSSGTKVEAYNSAVSTYQTTYRSETYSESTYTTAVANAASTESAYTTAVDDYSTSVETYNGIIASYNTAAEAYNTAAKDYNEKVEAYNKAVGNATYKLASKVEVVEKETEESKADISGDDAIATEYSSAKTEYNSSVSSYNSSVSTYNTNASTYNGTTGSINTSDVTGYNASVKDKNTGATDYMPGDTYSALLNAENTLKAAQKALKAITIPTDKPATTGISDAQNAYTAAQTKLTAATTVHEAYLAMDAAKTVYEEAVAAVNAATTALDEANKELTDAKALQTSAGEAVAAKLTDLYYYNFNFYASKEALAKVVVLPTLPESGNTTEGKSEDQVLFEHGITHYKLNEDGSTFYTYYLYILKHYEYTGTEADANIMSPMKFAVVRNNVYQMKIAGVEALGSAYPDPTDPDPTDTYYPGPNPDEDIAIYLKMELQVRHWVLRDQGDIKLK